MFKTQNGVVTIDATFAEICEITTLSGPDAAKMLGLPASLKKKDGEIADPAAIWSHVQGWVKTYTIDPTGAGFAEAARPSILKILNGDENTPGVLKSIALMQQAPGISRLVSLAGVPMEDVVKKLGNLEYNDLVALTPRLAILASATELSDEAATAIDALEQTLGVVIDPAGITPTAVDPAALQEALTENQGATPPEGAVPVDEVPVDEPADTEEPIITEEEPVTEEVVNNLPAPLVVADNTQQISVAPSTIVKLVQNNTAQLGSFQTAYTALGEALGHIIEQQKLLGEMLGGSSATTEIPANTVEVPVVQ